jgi:hypothetical protein
MISDDDYAAVVISQAVLRRDVSFGLMVGRKGGIASCTTGKLAKRSLSR